MTSFEPRAKCLRLRPRWYFPCVACLLLAIGQGVPAQAGAVPPSVEVQLNRLQKGALPHTLLAYGRVRPATSARRPVMAPATAEVGAVYVRSGQEVAKGARLLKLLPSPQATAAYARARSALRVARRLVTRTRQMLARHLATAQQLAEAEKSASDARADLAALRTQGGGGPKVLCAPFRAVVATLSAAPGAIVQQGAPLLELLRPDGLILQVGLQPAMAASVQAGDPAAVRLLGSPKTLSGTVLQRGDLVDAANGLVPVEIALPSEGLLSGEPAQASITAGEVRGYVVPHSAILADGQGRPYVVQAADMKARKVAVRILGQQGDRDVIAGAGLNPDQPLVLAGNYQLENGMRMRLAGKAGR